MATFSQLPSEVITDIWEYVLEPQDVESFALVSKRIYAIGAPFVDEHRKLKKKYSFPNTSVRWSSQPVAPVLLRTILLWPRVALYVTHFSTHQYYVPKSKDDMELFIEAIRRADLVPQDEVEDWITAVKEANDDPIVALLLLLLPNLCTMTLVVHSGFCRLAKTLRRISQAKDSPFLARLTSVNLEAPLLSSDNFMDWEWLSMSAALPLVQSLHVVRIGVYNYHLVRHRQCFEPGRSTVKEMALAFHLFESFKGLKKFTYSNEDERAEPCEPFWMGNALVTYAKYSLESLKLTSEWKDYAEPKALGSFRDCTRLREMEITVDLFVKRYSLHTLPDLFPTSIEKIHLHCNRRLLNIVKVFVMAKSQRLLSLRVLTIKLEPGTIVRKEDKAFITASQNKCRDVGIELTVFVLGWERV